jgi:hypothetical protein
MMVMKYHWGLAIGHTYSHAAAADSAVVQVSAAEPREDELALDSANVLVDIPLHQNGEDPYFNNPELGFENREDDWIDEEADQDEGNIDDYDGDNDEFLDFIDMYGLT